jgi:hypothetical protein
VKFGPIIFFSLTPRFSSLSFVSYIIPTGYFPDTFFGGFMKKFGFLTAVVCLAAGTIFAQGWGNASQPITVNGTLQLQNGQIAVAGGNAVYFVPSLGRYVGFIEGLKEGAGVSIDGYASGNYLEPSRITINGKSYDLAPNNLSQGWGGYGWGGYGHHGYGGYGCH